MRYLLYPSSFLSSGVRRDRSNVFLSKKFCSALLKRVFGFRLKWRSNGDCFVMEFFVVRIENSTSLSASERLKFFLFIRHVPSLRFIVWIHRSTLPQPLWSSTGQKRCSMPKPLQNCFNSSLLKLLNWSVFIALGKPCSAMYSLRNYIILLVPVILVIIAEGNLE